MRKTLLLPGLLVLCFGFWGFQTDKNAKKDNASRGDKNNSLLWRISGKGMKKPSFLFGTIHMICTEDYVWTDKMKESFDKSDEVCFEMNLDDPGVMLQAAKGMIDSSGKTLKDYFTAEQYAKLSQYLADSLGLQIVLFQTMKPIALETIITSKNLSCADPISYEETIMAAARKDNKSISGLETAEEQISLLSKIPVDSVIKDIVDILNGGNQTPADEEYRKMVADYKKQALPALYATLQQSKELGDDMGAFLGDRNKKWIGRIEKKIGDRSVFIAVGAGHLWGAEGVINLLKREGYIVEPIK